MKKIITMSLMILAVELFELTWMPQANAAEPPSYLVMCRSGGDMWASNVAARNDILRIQFVKSPYAASRQEPGPGQCAWMDRPLNDNEPDFMRYYAPGASEVVSWSMTDRGKQTTNGHFTDVRVRSAEAQKLINAVGWEAPFYVHVYNSNEGYLRITRVGR